MEYYKADLFTEVLQQQSAMFKALAHPARLAILEYLAIAKTCISGDISKELPLSRTTVNQHLAELKKVGLIKGNIDGSKVNYCLNQSNISKLDASMHQWINSLKNCDNNNC